LIAGGTLASKAPTAGRTTIASWFEDSAASGKKSLEQREKAPEFTGGQEEIPTTLCRNMKGLRDREEQGEKLSAPLIFRMRVTDRASDIRMLPLGLVPSTAKKKECRCRIAQRHREKRGREGRWLYCTKSSAGPSSGNRRRKEKKGGFACRQLKRVLLPSPAVGGPMTLTYYDGLPEKDAPSNWKKGLPSPAIGDTTLCFVCLRTFNLEWEANSTPRARNGNGFDSGEKNSTAKPGCEGA